MKHRLLLIVSTLAAFGSLTFAAPPPSIITHQGRIATGGVNINGTGYFKLALVDDAAATTYWNHDGSEAIRQEPADGNALAVPVTNGLYSIGIGDTSLPNMAALDPAVFAEAGEVFLRAWFSATGEAESFELLGPDHSVRSVPYALNAGHAQGVAIGGVTGPMIADGAITGEKLAAAAVTAGNIASGAISALDSPDAALSGVVRIEPRALSARDNDVTNLDFPRALAVQGEFVYAVDTSNHVLQVFDVSDPGAIVPKGSNGTNLGQPAAVAVQGDFAYVVDSLTDVLQIFDVSDPDTIIALDSDGTNLGQPYAIAVQGDFAYVVDTALRGLQIFDVSNPAAIVAKGMHSATLRGPVSLAVQGDFAYVADILLNKLQVLDISNPDAIVPRGSSGFNLNEPRALEVQGNFVYVVSEGNGTLQIFDASDPDNLVPRGFDNITLDIPQTISVQGDYAYVTDSTNQDLRVFDVSNPDQIIPAVESAPGGFPIALEVRGNFAYLLVIPSGLRIFELAPAARVHGDLELTGGRLGIGTNDPRVELHVVGDARVTGRLFDSIGSTGTAGQVLITLGNGTRWWTLNDNSATNELQTLALNGDDLSISGENSVSLAPYLRSDTSDSYSSGTLSFDPGTAVNVNGDLSIGTDSGSDDDAIYFDTGAARSLLWDDSDGRFEMNATLALDGRIHAGASANNFPSVNYNFIANDAPAPTSGDIANSIDLYISGDLEVGQTIYGSVSPPSDRNLKEHFAPVDPEKILERVTALPITTWQYKARRDEDEAPVRHIGAVAQDFHAAFAIGRDDRHIATIDADGVALAAIQGLAAKLDEKENRIAALEELVEEMRARMVRLEEGDGTSPPPPVR